MKKEKEIEKENEKDTERFNVSMKKSLSKKIQNYADDMGVSRSAFIAFACSSYISQQETLKSLSILTQYEKSMPVNSDIENSDDVSAAISKKNVTKADIERVRSILGE